MTINNKAYSYTTRYFSWVMENPKRVLLFSLMFVLLMGFGITKVHKESSVDAFVPQDHPAAYARDRAAEIFGLEDPIVVGLVAPKNTSAFTPENIETLRRIESKARTLANVKKHNFISILNESAIRSKQGDLIVEAIVPKGPITLEGAQQAFTRLNSMNMMKGLLASQNGDMLTLIIPVNDANHATETYRQVLDIANSESTPSMTVHVTGVASMNGRLAQMVTMDTRLFVPVAVVVALLIVWLALRNLSGLLGPFYVIAGSAATTIGFMGWMGAQYYLITTALPVIIMAIAIADSLHISTLFLHKCRTNKHQSRQQNLLDALNHTYLPITLTTFTTVAGFSGLALGSTMQPIAEFGWLAAFGAIIAWLLSVSALPAIMVLSKLQAKEHHPKSQFTLLDRYLKEVTQQATQKPATTAGVLAILALVMGYFALHANFDYQRQNYFQSNEQVRIADITLNERLSGLNFLDVMVSGKSANDLMTPQAMKAIAHLQGQLNEQPLVAKTTSIADYMTLMHSVLTDEPIGRFPSRENAPAQYMFLYEASGDPGDFNEEIDLNYQHALIRAQLSSDRFSSVKNTVQNFEMITKQWSSETGLDASVSGRVAVNVGWMSLLAESHFTGLGLAILFVFTSAFIMFRSFFKALLSLVPVVTGVLFTYAAMGALSIDIAPATSMTAAISTGLGVDFAIHLISSLNRERKQNTAIEEAFLGNYLIVARACMFSALALAVALSVVCLSSAPPLQWFGALVAIAALGSLMGAIFVIPALYSLFAKRALSPKLKGLC